MNWLGSIFVSISNWALFIPLRMWLSRNTHESRSKLVPPWAHRLVNATEPQWSVFIGIIVVECINQKQCIFVSVPLLRHYCAKTSLYHELVELERSTTEHVDLLGWPPQLSILDPIEAWNKEDDSPKHIELLQGELVNKLSICHWDQNLDNPYLWKAHLEETKLIILSNLVPLMVLPFPRIISSGHICAMRTDGRLFPSAFRRRSTFYMRIGVLWPWLVLIINCYSLVCKILQIHFSPCNIGEQ